MSFTLSIFSGLCGSTYLASTNDITGTKNIGNGLLPVRYSRYGGGANIRTNITLNYAIAEVAHKTTYPNGVMYQSDQVLANLIALAMITDADSSNPKFHDFLLNKVMIITGAFGDGHAVLCGPHLEVNMRSYTFNLSMGLIRQPEAASLYLTYHTT